MQTYASDTLYHLVGRRTPEAHERNFETLCQILRSMEIRPRMVDGQGGITFRFDPAREAVDGEPIEQTVCSFCDIHFSQLHPIHTGKYGLFGVGVDRRWVAEWGGRPVIYIPRTNTTPPSWANLFRRQLMNTVAWLHHYFPDEREGEVVKHWGERPGTPLEAAQTAASVLARDFLGFFKEYDVELPDDHPDNFYMEREWRKYGKLPLELPLRQIVVPEQFVERTKQQFPWFGDKIVALPGPRALSNVSNEI